MKTREAGFTLIEIAIVLVIIGLLLGGVLKGQELITGARVRNVIQQQDGIKAAYFGFLDRYRALPGDYANAFTTIPGMTAGCNGGNGNGDGQISTVSDEHTLAWEHLSHAQFMNGNYECANAVSAATSPANPYGQFLVLVYDDTYAGTAQNRHNLKTGGQLPSDVLGEIDRKVDDGNALEGSFRAQTGAAVGAPATCYAAGVWASATPGVNCGGVTLF
jgi:prepilin-type N-terminal cleavage/methylation domain-containing protein